MCTVTEGLRVTQLSQDEAEIERSLKVLGGSEA